jgi:hypothetical protein
MKNINIPSIEEACIEAGLMCDSTGIHCETDEERIMGAVEEAYKSYSLLNDEGWLETNTRRYEERAH